MSENQAILKPRFSEVCQCALSITFGCLSEEGYLIHRTPQANCEDGNLKQRSVEEVETEEKTWKDHASLGRSPEVCSVDGFLTADGTEAASIIRTDADLRR